MPVESANLVKCLDNSVWTKLPITVLKKSICLFNSFSSIKNSCLSLPTNLSEWSNFLIFSSSLIVLLVYLFKDFTILEGIFACIIIGPNGKKGVNEPSGAF